MPADGLRTTADEIRKIRTVHVRKSGQALRKSLLDAVKGPTGGDRVFSGLGPNAKPLGVRLSVQQGSVTTSANLGPSPRVTAGPWRWADTGTQAGTRAGRRKPYYHPGTSGAGAWTDTAETELPKVERELRRRFDLAVTKGR